jgi:hypothetical protein
MATFDDNLTTLIVLLRGITTLLSLIDIGSLDACLKESLNQTVVKGLEGPCDTEMQDGRCRDHIQLCISS